MDGATSAPEDTRPELPEVVLQPVSDNEEDSIDENVGNIPTRSIDTKLPQFYDSNVNAKAPASTASESSHQVSSSKMLTEIVADSDGELQSNIDSFVSSQEAEAEADVYASGEMNELGLGLGLGLGHSKKPSWVSTTTNDASSESGAVSSSASISSALGGSEPSNKDKDPAVYSIDDRLQTRLSKKQCSASNPLGLGLVKGRQKLLTASAEGSAPVGFESLIDSGTLSTPWEAFRWSKLRKLSTQVYSDNSRVMYGDPAAVLVSSKICIGTTKGYVMVFDYHQTLETILGQKVSVETFGAVTALATSVDQSFIAAGYSNGTIVTWDLKKPTHFNIMITPLTKVPQADFDSEGHLQGTAVLHLAFVGRRHSCLVSGDTMGLVFVHDTFRTILAKTTKSKRILGRYLGPAPSSNVFSASSSKKRNAILAMEPRPLGLDAALGEDLFLLAIITPHYLVIVSPFPNPQTQFKSIRHKDANVSMGFSACLSWYPGVKDVGDRRSTALLAYSWSNICKILEVRQAQDSNSHDYRLSFHSKKKFTCDEPIADIEWVNPKLLVVVTITQRLLVVNEDTMTVSAVVDLSNKHPMHHDYFSSSLSDLKFTLPGGIKEPAVLADSYANSIRVFKGKLFLLGEYEFVVGTLSAWADRLMDIMESGDYVRAIALATSFYLGEQDFVSLGLPRDDQERQEVVAKTIPDLLFQCLRFIMKSTNLDSDVSNIREVVDSCLIAVCAMNRPDLLDPIYDHFGKVSVQRVFFDRLVDFIYNGELNSLPPRVLKDMIIYLEGSPEVLEDIICRLDTSTLDLDLTLKLCESNGWIDDEIYIWNTAMHDYITPLMKLIKIANKEVRDNSLEKSEKKATTIYPYLSYVFTGQVYPTGLMVEDPVSSYMAKCSIYQILLSGTLLHWDSTYDDFVMKTSRFPYLSLIIQYDCPAFFSAFNEAFEDSFLNDGEDKNIPIGVPSSDVASFGKSVNRQLIVSTLLDIFNMESFGPEMRVYLNIFLARNYPKFSQYIMLLGKQLTKIMEELCLQSYPNLQDECELALQSLLSKFRPMNVDNLVSILYERKYYSVLQYLFKSRQRYGKYLEISFTLYLKGGSFSDVSRLFSIIEECLSATVSANPKERSAVLELLTLNYVKLCTLNCENMVSVADRYAPALHDLILKQDSNPGLQTRYLRELFRLSSISGRIPLMRFRSLYISLLSRNHENAEIQHLLNTVLTNESDVELPSIVDDLIENRCIDILVFLLCRQHRDSEAMIYLLDEVHHLDDDLMAEEDADIENVKAELQKFVNIGIGICQAVETKSKTIPSDSANSAAALWTRLLDNLIKICNNESVTSDSVSDQTFVDSKDAKVQFKIGLLKMAISSLLNTAGSGLSSMQHNKAVIDIFRSVLSSEPKSFHTVGAVRPILDDLYTAYGYQRTMLLVTKGILEEDAYEVLLELVGERLKGWRVSKTGECEGCGRKVVGVGVDADWLYNEWERNQKRKTLRAFFPKLTGGSECGGSLSGSDSGSTDVDTEPVDDILVVFKCGHTYHRQCLEKLGVDSNDKIYCVVCDSSN